MNIQSGLFHDVSVWHTTHRFITDGTASRDLMACADAFQIAPLESPANQGTAIMQGAICQQHNLLAEGLSVALSPLSVLLRVRSS